MATAHARRIADTIVGAQRRHARNVRLALALGAIMLVALTIPAVVLAGRETEGRPAAAPAPTGRITDDRAQIYAEVLGGAGGTGRVFVSTRLCSGLVDMASGKRGPCPPGTIGPALQQQIRAVTGPRVVFSASPPRPGPAVVVHLGAALVLGDRAEVAYDANCGQLCGHGETVLLTRVAGQWTRTGTGGYSWIS